MSGLEQPGMEPKGDGSTQHEKEDWAKAWHIARVQTWPIFRFVLPPPTKLKRSIGIFMMIVGWSAVIGSLMHLSKVRIPLNRPTVALNFAGRLVFAHTGRITAFVSLLFWYTQMLSCEEYGWLVPRCRRSPKDSGTKSQAAREKAVTDSTGPNTQAVSTPSSYSDQQTFCACYQDEGLPQLMRKAVVASAACALNRRNQFTGPISTVSLPAEAPNTTYVMYLIFSFGCMVYNGLSAGTPGILARQPPWHCVGRTHKAGQLSM